MSIINWTVYAEGIMFGLIIIGVYLAYRHGVRKAADDGKIPPTGLFDYVRNIRYYKRDPREEGYQEYKEFSLFGSTKFSIEREKDWNEWDDGKDNEDDYDDWDEEDEDNDWDEDDEEDDEYDWDDDEEDEDEDDNDWNDWDSDDEDEDKDRWEH